MKDYKTYLHHILDAIETIESYTRGISFEKFMAERLLQDGVMRNLEIIGEAVKNLPRSVRQEYKSVEWSKIAGMRDVLIHEYFGVDAGAHDVKAEWQGTGENVWGAFNGKDLVSFVSPQCDMPKNPKLALWSGLSLASWLNSFFSRLDQKSEINQQTAYYTHDKTQKQREFLEEIRGRSRSQNIFAKVAELPGEVFPAGIIDDNHIRFLRMSKVLNFRRQLTRDFLVHDSIA